MTSPSVSIIIPVKNAEKTIYTCLDAIYHQEFVGPLAVLLVDSGSTDRTLEIASTFPTRLLQIPPEQFHHAGTRHLAIQRTGEPLIVLLNGDAVPANSYWLSTLLLAVQPEDVAAAYSRQVPQPGAYPMEEFFLDIVYPPVRNGASMRGRVFGSFFSTVSCILKRSIYDANPFSPKMIISEDQEWSIRVSQRGYRILYAPESIVYHSHNYSLERAFRRFFDMGMMARISSLSHNPQYQQAITRRALTYPLGEILFLIKTNRVRWIPYALLYDFAKFFGYTLGLCGEMLPDSVIKKLSLSSHTNAERRQK